MTMNKTKPLLQALEDGDNILLTGGAGVGKTYHTNKLIEHLHKTGRKFAVTALTGLASQHLHMGMTIHRFLGVGNKSSVSDIGDLKESSAFYEAMDMMKEVSAIFIDEVSMKRPDFFELMDLVLRMSRKRINVKAAKIS